MSSTTTPNLGLTVPVAGNAPPAEPQPLAAQEISNNFNIIDSNVFSLNNPVPSAAININGDLTFNSYNASNLRSVRLTNYTSPLSSAFDVRNLYSVNGDLWYNNGAGTQLQLTSGSSINAALTGGGIIGDYSNPGVIGKVSYTQVSNLYTFTADSQTYGNLLVASGVFNAVANTTPLTPTVQAIGNTNNPSIQVQSQASGSTALGSNMPSVQLLAGSMSTTNKYTPALQFGSVSSSFSSENPKFLAGVVGRATETYSSNTSGGMALDFLASPNNPGASSTPSVYMTIDQGGSVGIGTSSPSVNLHILGNVAGNVISRIENQASGSSAGADLNLYTGNRKYTIASDGNSNLVFNDDTAGLTRAYINTSGNMNVLYNLGVGSGGADVSIPFKITNTNFTGMYLNTTSNIRSVIGINANVASNQAAIEFLDQGVGKYLMGKQIDNSFMLYDEVNSKTPFSYNQSTTNLTLQSTGGNVGIGTTTPKNALDVSGGIAVGSFAGSSTTPSNGLIVSGNVGINETNPQNRLQVTGTSQTNDGLQLRGSDSHYLQAMPSMGMGSFNPLVQAGDAGIIYTNNAVETGNLVIAPWSASSKGVRLTSDGYVGIGTSPSVNLEVYQTISSAVGARNIFRVDSHDANNVAIVFQDYRNSSGSDWTTRDQFIGKIIDSTYKGYFAFYSSSGVAGKEGIGIGYNSNTTSFNSVAGTPALFVNSSQRVAVNGLTTASSIFTVNGKSGDPYISIFQQTLSSGNVGVSIYNPSSSVAGAYLDLSTGTRDWQVFNNSNGFFAIRDNTATTDRITIDQSGNVGVGNTSPSLGGNGVSFIPGNTATNSTMLIAQGDVDAYGGFRQTVYSGQWWHTGSNTITNQNTYVMIYNVFTSATSTLPFTFTPPFQGTIVGITANLQFSVTQNLVFQPYINGVASTVALTLPSGQTQATTTSAKDSSGNTFSANQPLTVKLTSAGSVGTTVANVWLIVEM